MRRAGLRQLTSLAHVLTRDAVYGHSIDGVVSGAPLDARIRFPRTWIGIKLHRLSSSNPEKPEESNNDEVLEAELPEESQEKESGTPEAGEEIEQISEQLRTILDEKDAALGQLVEQVGEEKKKRLIALADAENLRTRLSRESAQLKKYAIQGFVQNLLGCLDNLDRAVDSTPAELRDVNDKEEVVVEPAAVLKALNGLLTGRYDPMGEPFDPNEHMARFELDDPSKPPGTIGVVTLCGYKLHERIVRPAEVGVVRKREEDEGTSPESDEKSEAANDLPSIETRTAQDIILRSYILDRRRILMSFLRVIFEADPARCYAPVRDPILTHLNHINKEPEDIFPVIRVYDNDKLFRRVSMRTQPHDNDKLSDDAESEIEPLEIESVCVHCSLNGTTTILRTSIPHFRDVVIMAFSCTHCGFRNNELQPMMTCEEKGVFLKLSVPPNTPDVLSRQIVKSRFAVVRVPELDLEIPTSGAGGYLTTIEGLLRRVKGDLMELQDERRQAEEIAAARIDAFCDRLETYADGLHAFTVELDDPSGNSHIESPSIEEDPLLERLYYDRTQEQTKALGVAVDETKTVSYHGTESRGFTLSEADVSRVTGNAFIHQYSAPEEVMTFSGKCMLCNHGTETRMYPTKIPYFKEVIVMATTCDGCGYKSSELRPGGGISPQGKTVTLRVLGQEDLIRDVIKSDTASLEIPAVSISVNSGTATVTTVEGLVRRIVDDLRKMYAFQLGDSSEKEERAKLQTVLGSLEKLLDCTTEWTIVIRDPLANSFIMPTADTIEQDPNLTVMSFERSKEENEELGIDALQELEAQQQQQRQNANPSVFDS